MLPLDLLLPARLVPMLMRFTAREEQRYYLNGFCVEPVADHEARTGRAVVAAATDGHTLLAARAADAFTQRRAIWSFPPSSLRTCAALSRGQWAEHEPTVWLAVPAKHARGNVVAEILEGPLAGVMNGEGRVVGAALVQEIDGEFPEWRRTVPAAKAADAKKRMPNIAPRLLERITAVSGELGTKAVPSFLATGENAPIVFFPGHPDLFGVVMPIRSPAPDAVPEWVRAKAATHDFTPPPEEEAPKPGTVWPIQTEQPLPPPPEAAEPPKAAA